MTKPSSVLIAVSLALCGLAACARDPIVLDEADFDLRFEPGVLDLGAAAPGAASRATAQLVNRGSISVRLAQAPRLEHVDLGFSVSALLPDAIAPGASHPIEITFTAAGAEGRRDTALALAYAVGEQARPLRLTLRGVVTASPDAGFPPDATASAADAASTPDAGVVPDANHCARRRRRTGRDRAPTGRERAAGPTLGLHLGRAALPRDPGARQPGQRLRCATSIRWRVLDVRWPRGLYDARWLHPLRRRAMDEPRSRRVSVPPQQHALGQIAQRGLAADHR
jgi:hypothetical protein